MLESKRMEVVSLRLAHGRQSGERNQRARVSTRHSPRADQTDLSAARAMDPFSEMQRVLCAQLHQ
jgi:hypothetical protein